MSRVTEGQLVVPSLVLLNQAADGTMTTTDLSKRLRSLLNPSGDDLAILSGRNDDRFSQKVRNLKSHDTLKRKGFAEHVDRGFRITNEGRSEARRQAASIEALAGFTLDLSSPSLEAMESGAEIVVLDENIITEGQLSTRSVAYRKRSRQLREAAVDHYTRNGRIPCDACSFDFELAYVDIGVGYIQIHHLEPISFGGQRELPLDEAVHKVRPLCANCHVMVHYRDPWITVENLTDTLRVTYSYA